MERKLGKGIEALIPQGVKTTESDNVVDIDSVIPNRLQPRKKFNDSKLKELVDSIREKGVIQWI